MRRPSLLAFVLFFSIAACADDLRSDGEPIRDAGPSRGPDGGAAPDGGVTATDGGASRDAGVVPQGPAWWQIDDPAAAGLNFTRIVGTGADDVYLLGQGDRSSTVLHYDGATFSTVSIETGRCGDRIADIGLAGDDLVVFPASCGLGIARRTAGVWSFLEFERNLGTNVRSLWVGPDVYWVTGFGATYEIELDGSVTDHGGINLGGTHSISGTARDDVYIGGAFGVGYYDGQRVARVNGGREVFAVERRKVWSLNFDDTGANLAAVLQDGEDVTVWQLALEQVGGRIHANGDDVWMAAAPSVVHQRRNGVFIEHRLPSEIARLRQVFVMGTEEIWFAGQDGAIVRYTAASLAAPAVRIEVTSAEVPEPIEPQPGTARLRLVNASGAGVRFCGSLSGSLTTRALTAADTSVGFFDVNIGANPQVTSFGVWIEPSEEPECRNSGVTFNRQTLFLTGDQSVTVYGTLDPEDRVQFVHDRYAALDAGQASLRVVRIGPSSDPVDVCSEGAPLAASVRANSRSSRFALASSITSLEVRAASTAACSGELLDTLTVRLVDRTSHSLVLDAGRRLLCNDTATTLGQDQSTCVPL